MDDKEKLIVDYLDNKQFNMDEDLKKLKEKDFKQKQPFKYKKLIFSVVSAMLVLIISLSIIIPNSNKKGERVVYFDDSQIEYTEVDDYDSVLLLMNNKSLSPKVEAQDYYNKSITAINNNKQVGIYSLLTINSVEYVSIYMYNIYSKYVLTGLNIYNLLLETTWNGYLVNYQIKKQDMFYNYEFSLTQNGIYHYFKVVSITNYEIIPLLNSLFS